MAKSELGAAALKNYEQSLQSKNITWVDMGIGGLTDFIPGLPEGDAILVRGEPGTGKTISALQFIHKGVELGENCVYITTEETPKTITRTGKELWSDFEELVDSKKITIINLSINAHFESEFSLMTKFEVADIVRKELAEIQNPKRIVIDSLSSLGRRLKIESEFREIFMRLLLECKETGATTLLTAEGIPNTPDITEYLVDHLIYLDYVKTDVVWTRVFILRKSRSVPLKPQILKLNIEPEGLYVEEIPISLKPVWFQSKL
jgi:KaiC/GvpD/RAD55 family RecA-like ATPase